GKTARSCRGILPFAHLAREGRMTVTIGRRELLVALGGAAVAWPLAARAQQPGTPVIGFLDGQSFDPHLMKAFRQAPKDAGYIEGSNVEIYFRSADGHAPPSFGTQVWGQRAEG